MVINFKKRSRLVALGIAAAVVIMVICFVMISSRGSGYAHRVSSNALRTVTVIVDAGHGGMDGGATAADGTVQVFSADGTQPAFASVDAEPQQGALCGAYLALSFDDSLRVMTRELSACGSTAPAEAFCLCPDGTVWCISDGTAARYIP